MDVLKPIGDLVGGAGQLVGGAGQLAGGIVQGAGDVLGGVGEHIGTGLKMVRDDERARLGAFKQQQQQNDLNSKLTIIKALGGTNTPAGQQAMRELMQDPRIQQLMGGSMQLGQDAFGSKKTVDYASLGRLAPDGSPAKDWALQNAFAEAGAGPVAPRFVRSEKKPSADKIPFGLSEDDFAQYNKAYYSPERLAKKEGSSSVADLFANLSDEQTPSTPLLADMIGGLPQDAKRTWHDDTVSPEGVKTEANNLVAILVGRGMDEPAAREKVAGDYAKLTAEDKGTFQKYPKMDVNKLFADQDSRGEAVAEGKTVLDTGDGIDTTPIPYVQIGITDPDTAEQFADLETMIGKALPDVDLRSDYQKDPEFYQQLLKAIREGVPDGKGQTRKLSVAEIVALIKGE